MKLTIVGGGGFRVPQIVAALARRSPDHLPVTELCLFDVSDARLRVMRAVVESMEIRGTIRVSGAGCLDEAVSGADFIFSAIRVGGTAGRVRDERIPLSHHVLGQETIGPGGYSFALRTIPAAMELARAAAIHAPDAWVINFTNPAGVITQAMRTVLGRRVIGICDTPIGLVKRVARALGRTEEQIDYDYVGLNHLGWLRGVSAEGRELLPQILASDELLGGIEEARLIGMEWVRALGMLPNEYLFYYYRTREAVAQILAEKETRGEFLARQQESFYERAGGDLPRAYELWTAAHNEREATYMAEARAVANDGERHLDDLDGGYQEVALDLMEALSGGRERRMILNVANAERGRRVIPALDDEAIIEVPCVVDRTGPTPVEIAPVEGAELGLIVEVKACENAVIEAALTHDAGAAWRALAGHPVVDSVAQARAILAEYCAEIPEVGEVCSAGGEGRWR